MDPPKKTSSARLCEILVDDASWDAASPERKSDWSAAIADLLAEHHFDLPGDDLRLLVTDGPDRLTLALLQASGQLVAQAIVPVAALSVHLREYVDTCRDMVSLSVAESSPKMEALDIAKRIIHDEAAQTVQSLCRVLRPDHPTARRLFTLIVTLRHDTTRL